MKKPLYLLVGVILSLTLAGCNQNQNESTTESTTPTVEPTTEPTTEPTEPVHVHEINEYGYCATCGEYLGTYPNNHPEDNTVPVLKENECSFYKLSIYPGHIYSISDLKEYSYEETCWYGHSDEGFSLVTTNQSKIEVDGDGKIDGKLYDFAIFKIKASSNHEKTGSFEYYVNHGNKKINDFFFCEYDGSYVGKELTIGEPSGDGYAGGEKGAYRCKIENGNEYTLGLTKSEGGEIKYYTRIDNDQFQEIVWGDGQKIALSSSDSYVYILVSAPAEGFSVLIGIY